MMEIRATTRYVRLSSTKAHDLARALKGRSAGDALQVLEVNKRKAAELIGKTLKSAIANAENNAEVSADRLWVSQVVIENGPSLRRFRPRARGSASPIQKKTSHIRVTLTTDRPRRKK